MIENFYYAIGLPSGRGKTKPKALECYAAAREGKCLIAYANIAKDVYSFGGGKDVRPNLLLKHNTREDTVEIVSLVSIKAGEELLLPEPSAVEVMFNLPKTQVEEQLGMMEQELYCQFDRFPSMEEALKALKALTAKEKQEAHQLISEAQNLVLAGEGGRIMFANFNHNFTAMEVSKHWAPLGLSTKNVLIQQGQNSWASDATINGIISCYSMLYEEIVTLHPNQKRVLFINSLHLLFDNIERKDFYRLGRSLRAQRKLHGNIPILSYGKIIIAHSDPGHWVLYSIFLQEKTIAFYDSMNQPPQQPPQLLLQWLQKDADEQNIPFNPMEWKITQVKCTEQVTLHYHLL